MRHRHRASLLAFAIVLLAGCRPNDTATGQAGSSDVFGDPVHLSLLEPFQGTWNYDFDRTVAVWESQGVPAEQIDTVRQIRKNPALAALGETLNIDGHVATGIPFSFSEFRLFGLHEHDGVVCGKAWHHEDANDPGDMSKCHVKLRLVDKTLRFDVWMSEGLPDLNDRDLTNPPAVVSGSAADCDAPADDRDGWSTSVFTRSTP